MFRGIPPHRLIEARSYPALSAASSAASGAQKDMSSPVLRLTNTGRSSQPMPAGVIRSFGPAKFWLQMPSPSTWGLIGSTGLLLLFVLWIWQPARLA